MHTSRNHQMKLPAVFAFATALALTPQAPAGTAQTVALGDLRAMLAIDPDPPQTGTNTIALALSDAAGKPIDGATLGFVWDMPAMGSMPEMKGGGTVSAKGGGRYLVSYPLSMTGDWYLTLAIDAPGQAHRELKMKVATGRAGLVIETPAEESGGAPGAGGASISVSEQRRQLIGVVFATVEPRPLVLTLRAAGRVEVDERNVADVTLKYEAYVQKVLVGETGKTVRKGQPLAVVYSPDLLAAEEELAGAQGDRLAEALKRRLAYWDLSAADIQAMEKGGKPDGRVTLHAPAAGVVLEKNVVEGTRLEPGAGLYRIGNLGRVWVQAAVSERDAVLLAVGQPARVTVPAMPAPSAARVSFVAPTVDEKTRTVAARIELTNPRLVLKPGMFADVTIEAPLGTRLAVPDSALLMSGDHRYAFVDRGSGRLQPVEVELGALAGDYAEVRAGLALGERVATGATFLLSSEAKLRDALPRWQPNEAAAPGPGAGTPR